MRARLTSVVVAVALAAAGPAAAEEWIELAPAQPAPSAAHRPLPKGGLDRARQLVAAGQIDAAIQEYRVWIEAQPDNVALYARLAELYGRQKRWDLAAATAEKGARIDPKNPEVLTVWGHALTRLRRYPDAIYVLEGLVKTHAASSLHQPYYNLAKACYELGWYPRSLDYALRHLQVAPSPQGHMLLARTYLKMGQRNKALAEMQKAVVRFEPIEDAAH